MLKIGVMKLKNFLFSVWALSFFSFSAFGAPRVIELKTEMVNGAVHWMPEKVEVKQGEKVTFLVKHEVTGGFNLHGFSIPALKIAKQVDRSKPLEVTAEITVAPGDYDIGCQFHPKHVGAKLHVLPKDSKENKS